MTTFSSVGSLLDILEETTEVCDIHNTPLLKIKGTNREPECLECAKLKHEEREKELIETMTRDSHKSMTQSWLNKRSILLDNSLKAADFNSYKTTDEETSNNKQKALDIARKYYSGGTFNTIFTGKAGTGKSHLSMAMLKAVNNYSEPYRRCLFVSVDELMRRIKGSFNDRDSYYKEETMVDLLTEADLLVLDDLGAETGSMSTGKQATDFTMKVLYAVINGRMDKPTIFTTNLNSSELRQMYDEKLVSRMFRGANGHVIKFEKTNDKRVNLEF